MKEIVRERATALFGKELGLNELHKHLFEDVFPNAGEIRKVCVYQDGFVFENASFLSDTLKLIDRMPERTYEDIINKYIEMVVAHPFLEGNDFVLRLWLDTILRKNLQVAVDWSLINKEDYTSALKRSALNPDILSMLLEGALTKEINDEATFIKSIEASLAYEE